MSFFTDSIRAGASGAAEAYQVERSLRWTKDSSSYMSRTAGSATNDQKVSYSTWIKLTELDATTLIYGGGGGTQTNSNAESLVYITGDGKLSSNYKGGLGSCSIGWFMQGTRVLRDINAWYHIMATFDGTQSGDTNRLKFYVNGVQDPLGHICGSTNAGYQYVNKNGATQYIGRQDQGGGPGYADIYQAEAYFVDGTIYTPSDFIETDSETGQVVPKSSTSVLAAISLGNNGGYYNFSDNSGTTATTLGKDHSSNSNNFTPHNFSVSAGTGNDSLEDSPTNNFCVISRLDSWRSSTEVEEGSLKFRRHSSNFGGARGTFGVSSGKWYYEFTKGSGLVQAGWSNAGFDINDNNGDVGLASSGVNSAGLAYDSRGFW